MATRRRRTPRIRVFFVFDDPLDDSGINLSYVDIPTDDPSEAFARVQDAAESGELWENLYPEDETYPYELIPGKMMFLDISALPKEHRSDTTLQLWTSRTA